LQKFYRIDQQWKIGFHRNSKSSDMARARIGTVLGTMEV